MKTIMILTNAYDPDVRVYKEALYLVSKGICVEILCWDRNQNSQYPKEEYTDGVTIKRLCVASTPGTGIRQVPAFIKFILALRKYLKHTTYDFLHCHDLDGRIAGQLAGRSNTKFIFDMHEFYETGGGVKCFLYRNMVLYLIAHSIAALYENDVYLSVPYSRFASRLYSLKNYPDRSMIIPKPKTSSDFFRVCYHGFVRNQIPYFAALFEAVIDMESVRVDINGGGVDYPKLVEIAGRYKNVNVNGPYNGAKQSSELYANTDVLFCGYNKNVLNHQKDAEAVKFFEAIITGTPMIMQVGIGMGDKVTANRFGLAVETDNSIEIMNAIRKLMIDHDFYNNCRSNELACADKYRWENEVIVLDKVYELK